MTDFLIDQCHNHSLTLIRYVLFPVGCVCISLQVLDLQPESPSGLIDVALLSKTWISFILLVLQQLITPTNTETRGTNEKLRSRKEHPILASKTTNCQQDRKGDMDKVVEEHSACLRSGSLSEVEPNSLILCFSSP